MADFRGDNMSKFGLRAPVISAIGIAALGLLLATRPASAVVINFDNLGNGVVVTNQYPQATFSSDPGFQILTTPQNLGSSLPNFICTAPAGGPIASTPPRLVDFTQRAIGLPSVPPGANQ